MTKPSRSDWIVFIFLILGGGELALGSYLMFGLGGFWICMGSMTIAAGFIIAADA